MNPQTVIESPFKSDMERLRVTCSEAEFQTLRARIVAWLKKEYPVETGNPRLFYDSSPALPKGLDAWITAQTRTMPCGGNFGAQQVWEGSLEGRRTREVRALLMAQEMCHQERINRPKREKALTAKITEWRDRLFRARLSGSSQPKSKSLEKYRALFAAMRTAFCREDRITYEEMESPVEGFYDCPITNNIADFVDKKMRAVIKEKEEKVRREKELERDRDERRKADLMANAIVEAMIRRGL